MIIGMIVAMPEELAGLLAECGTPLGSKRFRGYEVLEFEIGANTVYVAGSGAGEIAAASTTQMLISMFDVDMIINFGVVGGLTPEMGLCSAVAIEKVVHYDYDVSPFFGDGSYVPCQYPGEKSIYLNTDERLLELALASVPGLKPVICASGDKFVEGSEAKRALHDKYNADICEMEAAGILITCKRCRVPALFIKAVSDGVDGGAKEFSTMINEAGSACVKALLQILNSGVN